MEERNDDWLDQAIEKYEGCAELASWSADRLAGIIASPAMDGVRRSEETMRNFMKAFDAGRLGLSSTLEQLPSMDSDALLGLTTIGPGVLPEVEPFDVVLPPSPEAEHERRHREAMERREASLQGQQALVHAVRTLQSEQRQDRAHRERWEAEQRDYRTAEQKQHRKNLWLTAVGAFFAGVSACVGAWQLYAFLGG